MQSVNKFYLRHRKFSEVHKIMYERLAELMEEKRITAYRLSQETGITQATLSRWKSGKNSPSSETLKILAKYFHVSTDYLLGNVSEPYFYLDNERIINDINKFSGFTRHKNVYSLNF